MTKFFICLFFEGGLQSVVLTMDCYLWGWGDMFGFCHDKMMSCKPAEHGS